MKTNTKRNKISLEMKSISEDAEKWAKENIHKYTCLTDIAIVAYKAAGIRSVQHAINEAELRQQLSALKAHAKALEQLVHYLQEHAIVWNDIYYTIGDSYPSEGQTCVVAYTTKEDDNIHNCISKYVDGDFVRINEQAGEVAIAWCKAPLYTDRIE